MEERENSIPGSKTDPRLEGSFVSKKRQDENRSIMFDLSAGDIHLSERGRNSSFQRLDRSSQLDLIPQLSFGAIALERCGEP